MAVSPLCGQEFIGRQSCASATCHGGVASGPPDWNSSLRVWEAQDQKHAQAGMLLLGPLSQSIVENLSGARLEDGHPGPAYQALIQERCVGCHAPQATHQPNEVQTVPWERKLLHGVDCESCHGPASEWLSAHTLESWIADEGSPAAMARKQAAGMIPLESWEHRTRRCVECHVGSRDDTAALRDMNHDMIAAGHPVLRFSMSYYHWNLPAHWRLPTERQSQRSTRYATFTSELPTLSQHVQAGVWTRAQAQTLAKQRLQAAAVTHPQTPFPEFAEFQCVDCHHDLTLTKQLGQVHAGNPRWNTWYATSATDGLSWNLRTASRDAYAGFLEELEALEDKRDPGNVPRVRDRRDWNQWAVWYWDQRLRQLNAELPAETELLLDALGERLQFEERIHYDAAHALPSYHPVLGSAEVPQLDALRREILAIQENARDP